MVDYLCEQGKIKKYLLVTETRERQRIVRFADEVEQSGGEGHSSKGAGTSSIQDFLLKMAGQPLPDKQVHITVTF